MLTICIGLDKKIILIEHNISAILTPYMMPELLQISDLFYMITII
jgi:hypothetical protein